MRTPITTLQLPAHAATRLAMAAGQITANPYTETDAFAVQADAAAQLLDDGLASVLDRFAKGQIQSALFLRGVPVPQSLPRTPAASFHLLLAPQRTRAEAVLATVGARLGEIFAYREWDGGQLVQNRYPIAAHHGVQTASDASDLVLHTEACFTAYPPDFLALLGLRCDPAGEARTVVADIPRALALLTPAQRKILRDPLYVFPTDRGPHTHGGRRTTAPVPVLHDSGQGPVLEYSTLLSAISSAGVSTLTALEEALNRCALTVELGTGDLLLIDNRRTVHGRTTFHPTYDGSDRWIQRVLMLRQLPPSGRIVPDTRLAHYPTEYLKALALPV
ncbi:TauD/TfdA family dioxygenase [Kitasatospora sp. NPDC058115]|uniref:TauD/TfdA family dioxygenase n=1 Tax=Kitasatospora sp. NPDC058115 TaxID=3346347 RepID=UPI0036DA4B7D